MLDPWLECAPGAADIVEEWSRAAGLDLVRAGRDGGLLADTAVAQPLIVAASLLAFRVLSARIHLPADRVLFAGHSVGELAAAAGAGYLGPETAVALARTRGTAMSAACAVAPTAMTAVMPAKRAGASDEEILAAIAAAGLVVANRNGGHQFVAAGAAERVAAFSAEPGPGIRAVPLAVAGAFHTGAMEPAAEPFAAAMRGASIAEPSSAMVGNGDGRFLAGPEDLRRRLVTQVTSPVRWDLCARTITRHAPAALHLELAPAGPLTRLRLRAAPETRAIAIQSPEDVDRIAADVLSSAAV
jgi:[acyl-carrier-protein] S-malonyltransferase